MPEAHPQARHSEVWSTGDEEQPLETFREQSQAPHGGPRGQAGSTLHASSGARGESAASQALQKWFPLQVPHAAGWGGSTRRENGGAPWRAGLRWSLSPRRMRGWTEKERRPKEPGDVLLEQEVALDHPAGLAPQAARALWPVDRGQEPAPDCHLLLTCPDPVVLCFPQPTPPRTRVPPQGLVCPSSLRVGGGCSTRGGGSVGQVWTRWLHFQVPQWGGPWFPGDTHSLSPEDTGVHCPGCYRQTGRRTCQPFPGNHYRPVVPCTGRWPPSQAVHVLG